MNKRTGLIVAAIAAVCAGCGESRPPPEETVFDAQTDALERAAEAEKRIQERAQKLEQQLEDFDDPTSPPR